MAVFIMGSRKTSFTIGRAAAARMVVQLIFISQLEL
jgi:hypothetical protein